MIDPNDCIPPHRVSHENKMYDLAEKFITYGWGNNQEALIDYPLEGKIQLLSGTHRHAASILARLKTIPVVVKSYKDVQDGFGCLDKWNKIMESIIVI